MSIRKSIDADALSRDLGHVEACADRAPDGTYELAKTTRLLIGDVADGIIRSARAMGLDAPNCDQIREVEAVIYGYLCDANPLAFATAEGFGEHVNGPAGPRIIAQAERNRDFLRAHVRPDPVPNQQENTK